MEKEIKWGILGLGKIAHTFAADIKQSKNGRIQAVASRSLQKAERFGSQYGAERFYASYEQLAIDPEVDIIYIATPHSLHLEHTLLCLNRGKHVLCEKPLALNSLDAEQMMAHASEKNLFLMEGIWTRFIPATLNMLDLIKSDNIGEIISIKADFGFKADFDPEKRLYNKKLGGGALLDIGLYPVYLSLLLKGEPGTIQAMARKSSTGADSSTYMLFDYPDGGKAILECSFEMNTPTEAFIYGTKGSIQLHSRFHHAEKITLRTYDGHEQVFEHPYQGNGYVHEIEHIHECLSRGKMESPLVPHSLSRQLSATLDRVKECIDLSYSE